MGKLEVFGNDEPSADRIIEFKKTGDKEDHSEKESRYPTYRQMELIHSALSTVCLIFSAISSGGSIRPSESEQSIRMNFGSREACLS